MKSLTTIKVPKARNKRRIYPAAVHPDAHLYINKKHITKNQLVRCRVIPSILTAYPTFLDIPMTGFFTLDILSLLKKRYVQLKSLKN